MFVKNGVTLAAALSLLGSVDAKRHQLHERGSRCNGDNLLNRFRGDRYSDAAISFCQTFINSVTYSVVTISTDEAHVSSPVTTYSTAYPSPLLTSSYPESRLSSACSCVSPPVITAVVTEYVASSTSTSADDATTTTSDDLSTITEDPSTTSTDDATTSTDDATTSTDDATTSTDDATTSTDDPSTTATEDPATTSTDDASTTSTEDPSASTTTDDSSTTSTDDPSTVTTDVASTTTDDPSATSTEDASTTSTDAATTATDVPAGPTSLGCYVEGSGGRALKNLILADDTLTVESCAAACTNYAFWGVEYGRECWCDDVIESTAFVSPDPSVCDMPCKGDATKTCGGSSTINIYGTAPGDSTPPAESPYTFLGCFAEPDGGRALPQLYASTKMTIELCHQDCSLAGYTFAALEYSHECFCGSSIPELAPLGPESCSAPCAGDPTETCGGNNALQLYKATPN